MAKKEEKTNVMRILDQHDIPYTYKFYENDGKMTGTEIAALLGRTPDTVFKTLVTVGRSGEHYVYVLPAEANLSLKKAAAAVGEKNIQLIPLKELQPLTGYVHGGCSPIGQKKQLRTVVDNSAKDLPVMGFSGGRLGCHVETRPSDLEKVIPLEYADICE